MSLPHTELPPRSQRYEHFPLDKDRKEIRLVQIKPDADLTNPIQLVLRTDTLAQHDDANMSHQASLEEQESADSANPSRAGSDLATGHSQTGGGFIALSYVWGPETPSSDVHIEDSSGSGWLSVRQNLHDFLTTRRDSSVYSPWFWIDQLCINQADDEERGHQVYQMSQIYSTAIIVEVWLGPSFEGSNEAMDFLCQRAVNPASATLEEQQSHAPALREISCLPYWSRLWIVQEIILANDVRVRLGNKTAPWPAAFSFQIDTLMYVLHRWATLMISGRDWGMVRYLSIWKECVNVRDRVFGLMGLVSEPLRFYPDYSIPLQDLLLVLLRSQINCLSRLSEGITHRELAVPGYVVNHIEDCALDWYWTLDRGHQEIDPKAVRSFLLKEIRPLLRGSPYLAPIKAAYPMKRRLTIPFTTLGNGPTILARLRLRLLLPDRDSKLWHYWHWKKITRYDGISAPKLWGTPTSVSIIPRF